MEAKERLLKLMDSAIAEVEKLEADLRSAKARLGAFKDSVAAVGPKGQDGTADSVSRRLQEKVKKEQSSVGHIEAAIVDAKGRVSAFEEALRLFPKEGEETELRAGTQLAQVRDILRTHGKAMALTEILKAIGSEGNESKRNSLRGSLAGYARDGRVFTKEPAPDTFGLIEFGNGGKSVETSAPVVSGKGVTRIEPPT